MPSHLALVFGLVVKRVSEKVLHATLAMANGNSNVDAVQRQWICPCARYIRITIMKYFMRLDCSKGTKIKWIIRKYDEDVECFSCANASTLPATRQNVCVFVSWAYCVGWRFKDSAMNNNGFRSVCRRLGLHLRRLRLYFNRWMMKYAQGFCLRITLHGVVTTALKSRRSKTGTAQPRQSKEG